jgi:erythromycin esterase-like protein|tara:strand:- start:115 stop:501 length:387 start_codon:yes stop_codon:yes gene_type:complete
MSPNGAWQLAARAVAASAKSLEELRHGSWASVRQQITSRTRAVLLGESSHGTEEFYSLRAELTRACIEHSGETPIVVGLEADFSSVWPINRWCGGVRPLEGDLNSPTHTPFSPYVAPHFPHMSEINSV